MLTGRIILNNSQESVFYITDDHLKLIEREIQVMNDYKRKHGDKKEWSIADELATGAIDAHYRDLKEQFKEEIPAGWSRREIKDT